MASFHLSNRKKTNTKHYLLLLCIPLLLYIVFFILPNLTSYYYSLYNYAGFGGKKTYVGFQNFVNLFNDRKFGIAFTNTITYTIIVMIGQTAFGLLFAVLLVRQTRINNFLKVSFYLPTIFSSVAVGFIWGFIFDPTMGVINTLLKEVGLGHLKPSWLGDRNIVMFSISTVHIWQAVGTGMILFIAGLVEISGDLYESASIEGANALHTFWYITLPMLRSVIVIVVVLITMGCFKSFDYVWVLNGGGGDGSSHVIATLLYKEGIRYNRAGYASAMAVVLSITVSLIALVQINLYKDKERGRGKRK